MPITWPVGVPEDVLVESYDESLADNLIETQMEQGPYKTRRRGSARFTPVSITIRMDSEQLETFQEWYYETLIDGSLVFNWRHPRTWADVTMQFRKPSPAIRAVSGEVFDVSMRLEVRPA
jgi:hypothetical protein